MKKFLGLLCLVLLLSGANAFAFSDIQDDTYEGKAINALTEHGVINGYSDNTFRPDNKIKRAELCKMINKLFEFTDVGKAVFKDVSSSDWFFNDVLTANEYDYIKGFADNTFRGNDYLSREQACVIIYRLTPLLEIENETVINDAVSHWAKDAVRIVANHKLLLTDENGNFRAKDYITRGEMATLLYPFIPKAKNDATIKGGKGTDAEIAIQNAVVFAQLKAAVKDFSRVSFRENAKEIIDIIVSTLEGTIDAGLHGQLIDKNYLIVNYGKEVSDVRNRYTQMSDLEKGLFVTDVAKLNFSTFNFLKEYFLGDKPII